MSVSEERIGKLCWRVRALPAPNAQQNLRQVERREGARIVEELLGHPVEVLHKPSGAPYLLDEPLHISLSHTKAWITVACHPEQPVGIDIEYHSSRAWRLRTRYIRPEEMALKPAVMSEELFCELLWCLKEAAYKKWGWQEVDFLRHLCLMSIDETNLYIDASSSPSSHIPFHFYYRLTSAYTLVVG